jgi:hypothetical protein
MYLVPLSISVEEGGLCCPSVLESLRMVELRSFWSLK